MLSSSAQELRCFPFLQFPFAARLVLSKWRTRLQTTAPEPNQNTQLHLSIRGCHISVCTDTQLSTRVSLSFSQVYTASLTPLPKPTPVMGWVLANSLLGQEHCSYQVLCCCVSKRSSSAVCSVPRVMGTGRIYIQCLGGARSPPNHLLQNPSDDCWKHCILSKCSHSLEVDGVAEIEM